MWSNNRATDVHWIFRLDWIFIDTIIIIALIAFLIGFKFIKSRSRWRGSFSNSAIQVIRESVPPIELKSQYYKSKDWTLATNTRNSTKSKDLPKILIFREHKKQKLLHILTEGLVSHGFDVIQISIQLDPCPGCSIVDPMVKDETQYLLSLIQRYYSKKFTTSPSHFIVLNYGKSSFPYQPICLNSNISGLILINPKVNEYSAENFEEILHNPACASKMQVVFSRKSFLHLKNPNLSAYLKVCNASSQTLSPPHIIEIAGSSFKYYETLLLGILIKILKNLASKTK